VVQTDNCHLLPPLWWYRQVAFRSVIHFLPRFPLVIVARAAALGGLEITHGFQLFRILLLASHQDGIKQSPRRSHSTWSLDDLWPLSRGCSQRRTWLAKFSWDILNTWPKQLNWNVAVRGSPSTFKVLWISQLRALFAKCHTVSSSQRSHLCRLYLR